MVGCGREKNDKDTCERSGDGSEAYKRVQKHTKAHGSGHAEAHLVSGVDGVGVPAEDAVVLGTGEKQVAVFWRPTH